MMQLAMFPDGYSLVSKTDII